MKIDPHLVRGDKSERCYKDAEELKFIEDIIASGEVYIEDDTGVTLSYQFVKYIPLPDGPAIPDDDPNAAEQTQETKEDDDELELPDNVPNPNANPNVPRPTADPKIESKPDDP